MKAKKLLCLGMAVILACSNVPGRTAFAQEDETYENDFDIEDGVLIEYMGTDAEVVIPEGVESIGEEAFFRCESLTSISIPEGVMDIDARAFLGCSNLTNINIPESVEIIGDYAFRGCNGLTNINISSNMASIGVGAFSECSNLIDLKVDTNNSRYFSEGGILYDNKMGLICCVGGKTGNADILDSVTSIANDAFSGCHNLTNISIPGSVTEIGIDAFENCENLISINIPEGVLSIQEGVFSGCNSLTNIKIPDNATSIGENAFSECGNLLSIKIPDRVTSIGDNAFYGCSSLTDIRIPDSVMEIGEGVFFGCCNLINIDIPESLTNIGGNAFADTKWLENEKIKNSFVVLNHVLIDGGECNGDVSIPNGVKNIGDNAFQYCTLTSVKIPESVINIGRRAFSDCGALTSINIPDGVKSIGDYAFYDCDSLTDIRIPSSVLNIGIHVFSECVSLESIKIPDGVVSIGDLAFDGCSNLISINIPDSVQNIGRWVFSRCNNDLVLIVGKESYAETYAKENDIGYKYREGSEEIPENPGIQEGKGFRYNTLEDGTLGIIGYEGKDTELAIPSEIEGKCVTAIGNKAFYKCSYLASVTIPESVVSIGYDVFSGCSNLEEINVNSENKNYLSQNGVLYNKEMTEIIKCPEKKEGEIIIPGSVTDFNISMENCGCHDTDHSRIEAFSGCKSLTSIVVSEGIISLPRHIFYDCKNLTRLTLPESLIRLGNSTEDSGYPREIMKDCSNLTLIVVPGSFAEKYAERNKIKYVHAEKENDSSCVHIWNISINQATAEKDGSITRTCTKCGQKTTETIYAPKSIALSKESFAYNNKNQKPSVTVRDSKGKALNNGTDYSVTYPKAAKNVGQYTVTINFKGNYSGTVKELFAIVPKGTSLSKVTPKKKGFTVKWKKQKNQTTGYEIAYSTDSKFSKKNTKIVPVKKNGTTSKSIGKLKVKKKYYVRIRTYKTVKGKKYYSGWSKVKNVTVKK